MENKIQEEGKLPMPTTFDLLKKVPNFCPDIQNLSFFGN